MLSKISAIALFTGLVLAAGCARADSFAQHFNPLPTPALDFVFDDARGQSMKVTDFRGRAVLVNFWATWCAPCVEEMPTLDKLQGIIGPANLAVIALDEEHHASVDMTAVFFNRHDIHNLAIYNDPSQRTANRLHINDLPTSLLIDREGRIIGETSGSVDWSAPDAVAFVREHLMK